MGTVSIVDYDFFHYNHVIPNLECAKLYTYFHNIHEIAVLTPHLEPARYTQVYIRKEYNDGQYPQDLFAPNCSYGGRAFNPLKYSPLIPAAERTIPNMKLYGKYVDYFGSTKNDVLQFRHILNCAHIRLSTDEEKPKTITQLQRIMGSNKFTGIIFHDYDLARVDKAYDIIYEISNSRHFVTKRGINPYPIGNKFPIQINSSSELEKWFKILAMPNLFFLQYNGFMENETLFYLCQDNKKIARQSYYNITRGCSSENQFLIERLPKIFKQVLFLRRQHIKILLNYDEEFQMCQELKDLIELWNCWLSFSWQENFLPGRQTLAEFCKSNKKLHYISWAFLNVTVDIENIRNSFQFVRENNYELFKLFYEWDNVSYKDGEFRSDWE